MDTYYDDRGWMQKIAVLGVAAVICVGMYVLLRGGATGPPPSLRSPVAAAATESTSPPEPAAATEQPTTTTSTVDPASIGEASSPLIATTTTSVADEPVLGASDPTADAAATPAVPTPAPTTTAAAADALGYPAAPDGTPLPIIATYDVGTVTLTGHVPTEAARARLVALSRANSQDEAEVVDRLIINERVPINVGVRVIETNSPRFPEGAAEITAEHAEQLDRVAAIMQALPHVNVLVIGHADQRGDETTNFALSDDRARAVLDYLVFLGVSPTRMVSQAAGESHLLTLDDDAAALALNRRTEFIFYGILVQ